MRTESCVSAQIKTTEDFNTDNFILSLWRHSTTEQTQELQQAFLEACTSFYSIIISTWMQISCSALSGINHKQRIAHSWIPEWSKSWHHQRCFFISSPTVVQGLSSSVWLVSCVEGVAPWVTVKLPFCLSSRSDCHRSAPTPERPVDVY